MNEKERFNIGIFNNPSGEEVFRVSGRTPEGKQLRINLKTYEEATARKAELEIAALNMNQAV